MRKINALFVIALISQTIWAADQSSALTDLMALNTQEPVQQFVTSDSAAPASNVAAAAAAAAAPAQQALPPAVIPPAPVLTPQLPTPPATPTPGVMPAPSSTAPLGLNAAEQAPENPFIGGLDIRTFLSCQQTTLAVCQRTKDLAEFQDCSKRVKAPACKQFLEFAKMTGMAPKDNVDLIKNYKNGGLDLVHLVRFGANYPGVYYAIGTNGDVVDLIFGPQTQQWDIRKDPRYPEIAAKFPNVQLFSVVDKLPQSEVGPDGTGLRLIFRFQLYNGCHACERAGYANIAYDFSDTGVLQGSSVVSLEPPR